MSEQRLAAAKLYMPNWILERWRRIAYLIVLTLPQNWQEIIEQAADEKFNKFVTQQVVAYTQQGRMPPDEIAAAVLNLADDYLAGREMTIRAGDYIMLQQYMRRKEKAK